MKAKVSLSKWTVAVVTQLEIWSHGEQLSQSEVVQGSRRLLDMRNGYRSIGKEKKYAEGI
jgi:hypothetical protein